MNNIEINEEGVKNATYFILIFSKASSTIWAHFCLVLVEKCLPGAAEYLKTVPSFRNRQNNKN